ncbi:MAG: cysteine desulfurase family protein [Bacillota bacterium]|nr:cysteine desulfurase family protein [Bacillota bacterium]
MEIYLDNSATTKVSQLVKEEVNNVLNNAYGNPSSLHDIGTKSKKKIIQSRKIISNYLGCKKEELIFTSGGTESNNLAIIGYAMRNKRKGKHIITTKIEHKSVLNSFKYLEKNGFIVTYLDVDRDGLIDLQKLKREITDNTILVSIMHINNEIGIINQINDIADLIKKENSQVVFHVDGVQSFGKYKINLKNIDMYSFSGHKIHCVKGIGGLFKKENIIIDNLLKGGQQENSIRPGTENLIGISALGVATEDSVNNLEKNYEIVSKIKNRFYNYINEKIDGCIINGQENSKFSPYILSVSIENMLAEVLLHSLESKEIYISTGSACNSKNKKNSHVLTSIGIDNNLVDGTIRISFSRYTTTKEIDYACLCLKESIEDLRKVIARR